MNWKIKIPMAYRELMIWGVVDSCRIMVLAKNLNYLIIGIWALFNRPELMVTIPAYAVMLIATTPMTDFMLFYLGFCKDWGMKKWGIK